MPTRQRHARPSPSHTLSTLKDTGRRQSQSKYSRERITAAMEAQWGSDPDEPREEWDGNRLRAVGAGPGDPPPRPSAWTATAHCRCPLAHIVLRSWVDRRKCDSCGAAFRAEPYPPIVLLVFTEELRGIPCTPWPWAHCWR